MIDNSHFDEVMTEVRRMAALKGWRRDTAFQAELVRICLKFGRSVMLLRAAVDLIEENWDHCPSPMELRGQLEKTGAPPEGDAIAKWRAEFRGEVRTMLHRAQKFSRGRQRIQAESYLRYAHTQHPDIVVEECRNLQIPWTPASIDIPDALEALNGRCTDEQLGRLRREGIRNALEHTRNAEYDTDTNNRIFWADHLAWAEREHPDEVAQLRAEPIV